MIVYMFFPSTILCLFVTHLEIPVFVLECNGCKLCTSNLRVSVLILQFVIQCFAVIILE